MKIAPLIGGNVWNISKYFMDQFQNFWIKISRRRRQINSNITCQYALTEYGDDFDLEACYNHDVYSTNRTNVNFVLNVDNDLPVNQIPERKCSVNKISSRMSGSTYNKIADIMGEDNFDNILEVTAQHDAIMAYYYLDENNKVKVTEIFDVTDSDIQVLQSTLERENNLQLQFDDEWDETIWHGQHNGEANKRRYSITEMSEYSLEDILDRDASNIFSDPESEWTGTFKIEEPEDDQKVELDNLLPESDHNQPENVYKHLYSSSSYTYNF